MATYDNSLSGVLCTVGFLGNLLTAIPVSTRYRKTNSLLNTKRRVTHLQLSYLTERAVSANFVLEKLHFTTHF